MKVPGEVWLQFEAYPVDTGGTRLEQTAFFRPKGLSGLLYWYLLYPVHTFIFGAMVRHIAETAEAHEA